MKEIKPLRYPIFFAITICITTLLSPPIFAHSCQLSGNSSEEIMTYNQCVANQGTDYKTKEMETNYESEIARLTQIIIRLEQRIAKIKMALSTINSTY